MTSAGERPAAKILHIAGGRPLFQSPGMQMGVAGLLAGIAAAGCGAAQAPTPAPLVFEGEPALTVSSASGALTVAVWWSPSPPGIGYDASQLALTDQTGAPVAGATLTMVPWMAAHGHGASVLPAVTETAPGVYVATPVDFYMAGTWQLRTRIQRAGGAGDLDDTAQPTVDVR
jgi:hypothetical protein